MGTHEWGIACTKCRRYRWAVRLTFIFCRVLCSGPMPVTSMWSLLPVGHWLLIIACWLLAAGWCQIQSSFQQEKPSSCGEYCNSKGEDTQNHYRLLNSFLIFLLSLFCSIFNHFPVLDYRIEKGLFFSMTENQFILL